MAQPNKPFFDCAVSQFWTATSRRTNSLGEFHIRAWTCTYKNFNCITIFEFILIFGKQSNRARTLAVRISRDLHYSHHYTTSYSNCVQEILRCDHENGKPSWQNGAGSHDARSCNNTLSLRCLGAFHFKCTT